MMFARCFFYGSESRIPLVVVPDTGSVMHSRSTKVHCPVRNYYLLLFQIDVYNNPAKTITTLLRIMLGDFDYSKLRARDPIIGPTFFFCYIFFIYFILINMFLAIINQTYMAVKEDLTQKRDDFDVSEYLKKQFMRVVKKLTFKGFRKKKRAKQIIVNDKVLRRKALDELTRWETDLLNRGYTEDEVYAVFGDYYAVAQVRSLVLITVSGMDFKARQFQEAFTFHTAHPKIAEKSR